MISHGAPLSETETEPGFQDDLKAVIPEVAGVIVLCECGKFTGLYNHWRTHGNHEYCSGCKKEFVYRPWWEW